MFTANLRRLIRRARSGGMIVELARARRFINVRRSAGDIAAICASLICMFWQTAHRPPTIPGARTARNGRSAYRVLNNLAKPSCRAGNWSYLVRQHVRAGARLRGDVR
jgi:hypothetical protein